MSRRATAAAVLLLAGLAAQPAEAGLLKRGKTAESEKGVKPAATAAAAPRAANAQERAAAQRLEPLARVAFWSREFNLDPRDTEAGVALAASLRAMGRYEEASETAKRALALKPAHVEALLEQARAEIARNQGFYAIEPAK